MQFPFSGLCLSLCFSVLVFLSRLAFCRRCLPFSKDRKLDTTPRLSTSKRCILQSPSICSTNTVNLKSETRNIKHLYITSFLMNIIHSASTFFPFKPSSLAVPPSVRSPFWCSLGRDPNTYLGSSCSIRSPFTSSTSSCAFLSSIGATTASNQETASVVDFEDFLEKDWSFLDTEEDDSGGDHTQNIDQIISAGKITETSKVLVSFGSESFVDRLVYSSPCEQLLVVHDSLFVLACIKEKYDKVNCWQGDLINVPEKWTPFSVVFLYFLPALPFQLDQVFAPLAKWCLPGARIVISHPQGRQKAEEQKRQYPDVVVSYLPEKMKLQSIAAEHSFEVVEFVDEPELYLSVLKFNMASNK